ncbi:DUF4158 domain-containing protein [Streptomyces ehimensis]|uniref:DUF4158 domain-containing protein n=1 Tax=Streptomyces ehimensis TaxID=68195 RepID=A0ABV9BVR3_9ACTN
MTSIERTAYPRLKRLITAHELHVFFTPGEEERASAEEVTDSDERQLALLVALKSYQRMGCSPKVHDVPEQVVEFVRRSGTGRGCVSGAGCGTTARRRASSPKRRCAVRRRRRRTTRHSPHHGLLRKPSRRPLSAVL